MHDAGYVYQVEDLVGIGRARTGAFAGACGKHSEYGIKQGGAATKRLQSRFQRDLARNSGHLKTPNHRRVAGILAFTTYFTLATS